MNEGSVEGLRKSSKALPASVTGPVRVVRFQGSFQGAAGLDTNTCCGTHVQTTAHLQAVKLLRIEKNKGNSKVVVAKRARRAF